MNDSDALNAKTPSGMRRIIHNYIDASATIGVDSKVWRYAVVQQRVRIGDRCIIWHGARLLNDVELGNDVMIGGGSEIGAGSMIGDRTRIGTLVFLPSHSVIGARVFIGPGVICSDDRLPVAGNTGYTAEPPTIEDDVSIGAGVILLPGVRIGAGARIAAGSVVTGDVVPHTVMRGLPARVMADAESGHAWLTQRAGAG